MNRFLVVCVCVVVCGRSAVGAPAKPKVHKATPVRPRTSFSASPEAMALLDQSIAAYRKLKGLSLRFESKVIAGRSEGFTFPGTFEFAREGASFKVHRIREKIVVPAGPERMDASAGKANLTIYDGRWLLMAVRSETGGEAKNEPAEWEIVGLKRAAPRYVQSGFLPGYPPSSAMFGSLLQGSNILRETNPSRETNQAQYQGFQTVGKRLPDTIIDGVKLQGVQIRVHSWTHFDAAQGGSLTEWTAWFDPTDHLLRRAQFSAGRDRDVVLARYFDVKTNPDFLSDYFKIPIALPMEEKGKE